MNKILSDYYTDQMTLRWSVSTNGGFPVLRYLVDWLIPGTYLYRRVPGGALAGDATHLNISFNNVVADYNYPCRIRVVNIYGYVSEYLSFQLNSSKGS